MAHEIQKILLAKYGDKIKPEAFGLVFKLCDILGYTLDMCEASEELTENQKEALELAEWDAEKLACDLVKFSSEDE